MDRVDDVRDLLREVSPGAALLVDDEIAEQLVLLLMVVCDQEGQIVGAAAALAEAVNLLDEVRHGYAMRRVRVGVPPHETGLVHASTDDPDIRLYQRVEDLSVDGDPS